MVPPLLRTSLMLASPVAAGGRLLVPVVRMLTAFHESGGFASCTPVALLLREGDSWSFVPLEQGITREILSTL